MKKDKETNYFYVITKMCVFYNIVQMEIFFIN